MDKAHTTNQHRFKYGSGCFEVSSKGVFFINQQEDKTVAPQWICSPLYIEAQTRDDRNESWGRLLKWQDNDSHWHQWAMPLDQLEGDGAEIRRELANRGVSIAPSLQARNLLTAYIKVAPAQARVRCVGNLGWHNNAYVTANETIGGQDEAVVFQNRQAIEPASASAGTVDAWKDSIANLANGNSRLAFVISCAFAGPLLHLLGEDSGGFHLRGGSSTGKTTALLVASTIWGPPARYVRNWRTTINGLESMAALHNDSLLVLDEIGQIDPGAVGDAAYMLANGQGKSRAQRNGIAKPAQQWRLLFLSAGEESLSALMQRAGKKATAGQEIRLAEIDADAGAEMGLFETLHDCHTPAALSENLRRAAEAAYGSVGHAWLYQLVEHGRNQIPAMRAWIQAFLHRYVPTDGEGQVIRVARRFALVAAAGEWATRFGLTGWQEGEAINAASVCFRSWLDNFGGTGNRETRAVLDHVMGFLETHGASRFENLHTTCESRVQNRVGYFRTGNDGEQEFLVPTQTFDRELCNGFAKRTVTTILKSAGVLIPGRDGKPTQCIRLSGLGTSRVYVLRYIGNISIESQ